MANVTEYLEQLLELTQKNLQILKGINDAFQTKLQHLNVKVGDMDYTIPSFISLESLINNLSENFYNLVHAPETGEAYFDFNGNTRAIEVKSYQSTPNSLVLNDDVNLFFTKENGSFEQLLFPNAYINLELNELPEDITAVVVKKIVPINQELKELFKKYLNDKTSVQFKYSDMFSKLLKYIPNTDYKEFEDTVNMPIKNNIGTGTYVVEKIIIDETSDDLNQYITFKIRTDEEIEKSGKYMTTLKYKQFDEIKEEELRMGDELTSYDGKTKLKIVGLDTVNNEIRVLVANGEYLNIEGCGTTISENFINDVSKVKFFRQNNVNSTLNRTLKLNLIDAEYVYFAVAPLNTRMNIRAPWGTGLIININNLKHGDLKSGENFYNSNIKNIGNVLKEVSTLLYSTISDINEKQFEVITSARPTIDKGNVDVLQINKHLKRDKSIENLIKLHKDKETKKAEIEKYNNDIETHRKAIAEISFDDVEGVRKNHEESIINLESKRNNAFTSITKIIQEIALIANDSEIPLENAKYRIRGWFDYDKFVSELKAKNPLGEFIKESDIVGIKVMYRYRSSSKAQGESLSMSNNFLFSDWNRLPNYIRPRFAEYVPGKGYDFKAEPNTNTINLPSFNQIDIPISQGEIVDIQLKVIYSYGYPFIETTSAWSNILTVEFPAHLVDSTKVTDIIDINNSDIENNKFVNMLQEHGVPEHLSDKIVDQSITYYHKPEHIPSGFYTPERRIIPLKDKLSEMDDKLEALSAEINGDPALDLNVTLGIGTTNYKLNPYQINNISVAPYSSFINEDDKNKKTALGSYEFDSKTGIASVVMYLNISSNMVLSSNKMPTVNGGSMLKLTTAKKPVKIYSLFPGDKSTILNDMKYSRFRLDDYAYNDSNSDGKTIKKGVWAKILNIKSVLLDSSLSTYQATLDQSGPNIMYTGPDKPDTPKAKMTPTPNKKFISVKDLENSGGNFEADWAGTLGINTTKQTVLQTADQFITSRMNNISTGENYYDYAKPFKENIFGVNDLLSADSEYIELPGNTYGAALYPYINSNDSLKMQGGSMYSYELLNGSHSLQIPLMFEYNLNKKNQTLMLDEYISKIISFDVRTSLYTDPINYTVRITARKEKNKMDEILLKNSVDGLPKYNVSMS